MNEFTFQKILLFGGICGSLLLHISVSDTVDLMAKYISLISFVVILVSNWYKFTSQVKYWIKQYKNLK